ncbi:hypothetical protein Bbelb_120070 [Branchiostoma belcheri]|nr:hypothetical protein Bbelb_120070 [Branchiostoma belcheri]
MVVSDNTKPVVTLEDGTQATEAPRLKNSAERAGTDNRSRSELPTQEEFIQAAFVKNSPLPSRIYPPPGLSTGKRTVEFGKKESKIDQGSPAAGSSGWNNRSGFAEMALLRIDMSRGRCETDFPNKA